MAHRKNIGPCSVTDCERPAQIRGFCLAHYKRWQRYGDPEILKRVARHTTFRGTGRNVTKKGYIRIRRPDGRWDLEHRWVMEQHLGRELHEDERVHHKNTNKSDNEIGNLELWVTGHPQGCRAEEAVAWAQEILRRYR